MAETAESIAADTPVYQMYVFMGIAVMLVNTGGSYHVSIQVWFGRQKLHAHIAGNGRTNLRTAHFSARLQPPGTLRKMVECAKWHDGIGMFAAVGKVRRITSANLQSLVGDNQSGNRARTMFGRLLSVVLQSVLLQQTSHSTWRR